MMKIVTLIIQLVAVSAGALGGLWLKNKDVQKAPVSHASDNRGAKVASVKETDAEKKPAKKAKKKKG